MTVKSEMSYRVVCDGCGEGPEDEYYLILHPSRVAAIEDALGGDWYRVGKKQHACGTCVKWDADGDAYLEPTSLSSSSEEDK